LLFSVIAFHYIDSNCNDLLRLNLWLFLSTIMPFVFSYNSNNNFSTPTSLLFLFKIEMNV